MCDDANNNEACEFDGGDCDGKGPSIIAVLPKVKAGGAKNGDLG